MKTTKSYRMTGYSYSSGWRWMIVNRAGMIIDTFRSKSQAIALMRKLQP